MILGSKADDTLGIRSFNRISFNKHFPKENFYVYIQYY